MIASARRNRHQGLPIDSQWETTQVKKVHTVEPLLHADSVCDLMHSTSVTYRVSDEGWLIDWEGVNRRWEWPTLQRGRRNSKGVKRICPLPPTHMWPSQVRPDTLHSYYMQSFELKGAMEQWWIWALAYTLANGLWRNGKNCMHSTYHRFYSKMMERA